MKTSQEAPELGLVLALCLQDVQEAVKLVEASAFYTMKSLEIIGNHSTSDDILMKT